MDANDLIDQDAEFSPDRVYRFRLWRMWAYRGPWLMVIGLNPSTADETADDPTIRRCIGFARQWGFCGLRMLNLFAYRATDPKAMKDHYVALSSHDRLMQISDNRSVLRHNARMTIAEGGAVLAAWGSHGVFLGEGAAIQEILAARDCLGIACLGTTKEGMPKHPLYLPKNSTPIAFCRDGGSLVTQGVALPLHQPAPVAEQLALEDR